MNKNTETTQNTIEAKKAKRAAYARAYYASHKEARKAAVKKCRAKKAVNEGKKTPGRKPAAKHAINPLIAKKAKKTVKPETKKTDTSFNSKEFAKAKKRLEKLSDRLLKSRLNLDAAKKTFMETKNEYNMVLKTVKKAEKLQAKLAK
jgi:hypothetical protein